MLQQPNNPPPFSSQGPSSSNNEMGQIESMFEKMMKKNADSDAQLESHNTSIRNEVQLGQISQGLNTRPKGAPPSDTIVNPKGGNNTGHAIALTTRSGRGGEASTSKKKEVVSDDVEVQNNDDPIVDEQVSEENVNGEVRIDIHDNEKETQNDVNPSWEHVIDIPEMVMPKAKASLPRPPPPYPQRLAKQNNEKQFKKFTEMMKSLSNNMSLVEALKQMPGYAKFMKDLVTKKRYMDCETIKMTHQVIAIVHSMAPKLEDPGAFTIPCTIGIADFARALCDLGVSINLMPYSVFKTLGVGQPRATSIILQMVDRTMKRPLDLVTEVIVDDTSAMINVEDPLEVVLLNHDVTENEGLVDATFEVLQRGKKEIGWTLADIQGISPVFCMHKIILEDDAKPSVEHQRRFNEAMKEAVK
ncbi:uncharacterized protein [Nicotiana sylvestris]|uniref:uncharacterized protein n=1 Tax=Nicotiana sylvestris TaxID=4096 RepID=UPI00388C948A